MNCLLNKCDRNHYFLKMRLKELSIMVLKHASSNLNKDLMEYEDVFQKRISIIWFRRVNFNFQNQLKNNIRSIQLSNKVFVFADQTRNICEMEKSHYKKLSTDSVTKT